MLDIYPNLAERYRRMRLNARFNRTESIRRFAVRRALAAICGIGLMAAAQLMLSGCTTGAGEPTTGENRALHAFEVAKADRVDALTLQAFLAKMPKGADLHMHLSGAVYAETFLKDAAADNLCIDTAALKFAACAAVKPNAKAAATKCPEGIVPAATVFQCQMLYDQMIDAFSMRSFVPRPSVSGHDQFFATFDRFSGTSKVHTGEWLDEVATRAAAQNEQYLEVMMTPSFGDAAKLGYALGWPATPAGAALDPEGDTTGTSRAELDALRAKLLTGGLRDSVKVDEAELDGALAARMQLEHCGQPDATAACGVKVRVLYQVLRAFPPQQVFAQTLLAFEVASADPNVVGLNFVQPEDAYMAMSEYNRQMHMLDYLHSVYPRVHISLHAGELAPGLVPPDGLKFHIREAVELGHAERIGHGVDVMYETDPHALLREMANRHVMVEINLTSNDVILGILPSHHPLPEYRETHVPVALSTDDEGVSRIDLTHEYVSAVEDYGLGYRDLKAMARASLEHSFLAGESLWEKPDVFTRMKPVCAGQSGGAVTGDCAKLLQASERAAQQWELERRFAEFEASVK
jgi:adenosine deaminase